MLFSRRIDQTTFHDTGAIFFHGPVSTWSCSKAVVDSCASIVLLTRNVSDHHQSQPLFPQNIGLVVMHWVNPYSLPQLAISFAITTATSMDHIRKYFSSKRSTGQRTVECFVSAQKRIIEISGAICNERCLMRVDVCGLFLREYSLRVTRPSGINRPTVMTFLAFIVRRQERRVCACPNVPIVKIYTVHKLCTN
jgi:hypothetical protein